MNDLILLVADKNMHFALRGALSRPDALGIRAITFQFLEHSGRDGGVRTTGPNLVALERGRYAHALLVMDFEGSGGTEAATMEALLDEQLRATWGDKAKAIVIEPELDVWMWDADNALRPVLRPRFTQTIREWLGERGFEFTADHKPVRPKEAMEYVMREVRKPRSSSAYEEIATKISLTRCTDPAFLRLRATLRRWFPL